MELLYVRTPNVSQMTTVRPIELVSIKSVAIHVLMLAVSIQFAMLSIINRFAHVHQIMSAHRMYNVVYHKMTTIQFVQNVKVIQIAAMTKHVSTRDVKIHAIWGEFAEKMRFAMCKHIDHFVFAKKDSLEMLNSLAMKVSLRCSLFIISIPITYSLHAFLT